MLLFGLLSEYGSNDARRELNVGHAAECNVLWAPSAQLDKSGLDPFSRVVNPERVVDQRIGEFSGGTSDCGRNRGDSLRGPLALARNREWSPGRESAQDSSRGRITQKPRKLSPPGLFANWKDAGSPRFPNWLLDGSSVRTRGGRAPPRIRSERLSPSRQPRRAGAPFLPSLTSAPVLKRSHPS